MSAELIVVDQTGSLLLRFWFCFVLIFFFFTSIGFVEQLIHTLMSELYFVWHTWTKDKLT